MTTLKEIESKLTNLVTDNQSKIDSYQKKIETADKAIQDANKKLKNAEDTVNVDDYNKAKNAIWSADHAKELYTKTKNKVQNTPLISKAEYSSLLKEITEGADNEQEALNEKAIELITNIRSLANESSGVTNKANKLMNVLQRKVYKEPEGRILKSDGGTTWSSDKEYRSKISVSGFYNAKVKGTSLSKLAGEEKQESNNYLL